MVDAPRRDGITLEGSRRMSTAARIDELRKKFEENPRRYFAPLANELRKAGDLTQAIALCREHLPKQPGHMSGYIVFGQALYESGALDEARSVFEQALSLDPENLIALRHLGDIAKAGGDVAVARRWYERVLDADPRNDDIASQLASLAAMPVPVAVRPTPTVSAAFTTPPIPVQAIGLGAVPTPDAALRAVDFDVVNARIAHYTPLDLDAIESAGAPAETTAPAPQPFESPRFGTPQSITPQSVTPLSVTPLSTTPLSTPSVAWDQPAAPPANRPPPVDNVWVSGTPARGTNAYETPSFGTASYQTPAYGMPAYPTPDAGTPSLSDAAFGDAPLDEPSAPTLGNPASGASDVHDALGAFAAHDPSDEMRADDFGFPATPLHAPVIEPSADADEVYEIAEFDADAAPFAEAFEEGIMAPEWPDTTDLLARVSSPRSITPAVVEITSDAVEAFGREPHDPEPVDDELPAEFEEIVAAELPEMDVEPVAQPFVSAAATPVDAFVIEDSADELVIAPEHVEAEAAELPWLAPPEVVEAASAQQALEEIADAFVSDARAVGDDTDVLVTSMESSEGTGAEVSFADVLDLHHDEASADGEEEEAEELAAAAPSTDSPAFVTETMAELLVSQGFIGRAANVYEELVRRHPYDPVLTSRLAELRDQLDARASDVPAVPDAPTPASFVAIPTPVEGTASFPTPSYGTPAFGTSAFPTPAFSDAVAPTPAFPTPAFPTPAFPTPAFPTPGYATPAYSSAGYDTPAHASPLVTPAYATPAFAATGGGSFVITARERFAQLAARRVPRRTPPQPTPAVEESEGLSSLFGENDVTGSGDDAAARALADAFAPISEADAASGAMLDFGDGDMDTESGADARSQAAGPQPRPTPPAGGTNAGFSFDRFFPDPATQSAPPATAEKSPDPASPVGDDLAQFSAWLKGLGTT